MKRYVLGLGMMMLVGQLALSENVSAHTEQLDGRKQQEMTYFEQFEVYIVQANDTLESISSATGLSIEQLSAAGLLEGELQEGTRIEYTLVSGVIRVVSLEDRIGDVATELFGQEEWQLEPVQNTQFDEIPAQGEIGTELRSRPQIEDEVSESEANEQQTIVEEQITESLDSSEEGTSSSGVTFVMEATAYSRNQPELSNFTANGTDLTVTTNVIAVDPSVIPLGTRVYIDGLGEYIAADTGSAIVGNRIDIHFESVEEALQFGRQTVTVTVLE